MIRDILQFAVPNIQNDITQQIEQLVSQILTLKQSTPSVSTTALEAEIDALVHVLYELTAEEIGLIEGLMK